MADDVVLPGAGATVATDDIGSGRQAQIVKIGVGADGAATFLSGGAGNSDAGSPRVTPSGAGTGTQSNVPDAAADTTILAANANRRGATVYNDSTAILYLLCANATSSTTVWTYKMQPEDYFEIPAGYTGIVKGIWASDAGGNARVTEFT